MLNYEESRNRTLRLSSVGNQHYFVKRLDTEFKKNVSLILGQMVRISLGQDFFLQLQAGWHSWSKHNTVKAVKVNVKVKIKVGYLL